MNKRIGLVAGVTMLALGACTTAPKRDAATAEPAAPDQALIQAIYHVVTCDPKGAMQLSLAELAQAVKTNQGQKCTLSATAEAEIPLLMSRPFLIERITPEVAAQLIPEQHQAWISIYRYAINQRFALLEAAVAQGGVKETVQDYLAAAQNMALQEHSCRLWQAFAAANAAAQQEPLQFTLTYRDSNSGRVDAKTFPEREFTERVCLGKFSAGIVYEISAVIGASGLSANEISNQALQLTCRNISPIIAAAYIGPCPVEEPARAEEADKEGPSRSGPAGVYRTEVAPSL